MGRSRIVSFDRSEQCGQAGTVAEVCRIASSYDGVVAASRPLSMYIGRHEVLLAMDLQFAQHSSAAAAAATIDSIEQQITRRFPMIKRIYIEAQVDLTAAAATRI